MPLVLIGLILFVAKLAEFGPAAAWSWWIILAPFGLAVLWWHFADSSGWTKRREMQKMEDRKAKRRESAMDALGLSSQRDKQLQRARADSAKRAARTAAAAPPPGAANKPKPSQPIDANEAAKPPRREPQP